MAYNQYKRPRQEEYVQQYAEQQAQPVFGAYQQPQILSGSLPQADFGHAPGMAPWTGRPEQNFQQSAAPVPPPINQSQPSLPLCLGCAPDGSMPVVKLRGLPYNCGYDQIRDFLEVDVVDIVLMKRHGRFSGEAFVVLPAMMQVDFALTKDRNYIGQRYVEVQPSSREDYYKAVALFVEDPSGMPVPPLNGGRQQLNRYGQPLQSGPANGMPRARESQKDPPTSSRSAPTKNQDKHSDSGKGFKISDIAPGPIPATGVLRLRGLPYSVTADEIAKWFNDIGSLQETVDSSKVTLVLAYDGRPTGSAFVEFSGPADAENAMIRDKANLGSRYVELFHSSKNEISVATGGAV